MIKKGMKKYFQCSHYEFEYDDLGKYCWCHNKNIPSRECMCKNIFQMNACPGFNRGERFSFLTMTKEDKLDLKKFKEQLMKEAQDREVEERALLKYLKSKYENC